jgi:hypothetical protein
MYKPFSKISPPEFHNFPRIVYFCQPNPPFRLRPERMKEGGAVAQSVEQRTENPCVGGSIPPHTTKTIKRLRRKVVIAFLFGLDYSTAPLHFPLYEICYWRLFLPN